jgi:hypothetical protein
MHFENPCGARAVLSGAVKLHNWLPHFQELLPELQLQVRVLLFIWRIGPVDPELSPLAIVSIQSGDPL